jgi:fatty acid synthase subunit beta
VMAADLQHYFSEFQALYDIYAPFLHPLLSKLTDEVLLPLGDQAEMNGYTYYSQGLDLISWLDGTLSHPTEEYLASIPLSMFLIGIAQLSQYVVACRVADVHPGEMRSLFTGATGHSQGIVSAVAIASSNSWDSLELNITKAVKHLFYLGLRGQEGFPLLSLEPHIVADSIENNEGAPTPMLGVYGLTAKALEGHIKKVNAHLPSNSQVGISLFNTTTAFVVTGPAKALYGLVTALRKVMAPPGLDQGRTPFSKRKAVFNMRFLPVNVPYHSDYLAGQTEKLIQEDLEGQELWSVSDLALGIYNTEDGKPLQLYQADIQAPIFDSYRARSPHRSATRF